MKLPYKRVELAALLAGAQKQESEDETIEASSIGEFPSILYETHDEAYLNDDVIKAYAVIQVSTGYLYIELVSEKLSRIEYELVPLQDRTDPDYGKINDEYLMPLVQKFDRMIHDEELISEN